jgi:HEAT repeats
VSLFWLDLTTHEAQEDRRWAIAVANNHDAAASYPLVGSTIERWFSGHYNGSQRVKRYVEGHPMNYHELSPRQLVDLLGDKRQHQAAAIALLGGITATELRKVKVTEAAKEALIAGLNHPNSKVRWWCIQYMDHVADESYLRPLLESARTDPTPKNRRHAIHALTCEICKPARCSLDVDIRVELANIAETDADESVKALASQELLKLFK